MDEADFKTVEGFLGYRTKEDETTIGDIASDRGYPLGIRYLVSGSKNVLVNSSGDKVISRNGYELFGAESSDRNAVKSQVVWLDNNGNEWFLREYNGNLEVYVDSAFETLLTGLSTTKPVRFADVWNATELTDILLFVNNSSILYEWSGGKGTYASATTNTLTINETIAEQKFLTSGTRQIRVKDSGGTWRTFTYTGESGSQFTGVTPDPTAFTFDANALVLQEVRSNSNTPASGFTNDTIKVLDNQAFVGSDTSRRVYISKNTSYTDYTFSTPRVPGEGALLTLDDVTNALEVGKDDEGTESMVIFSGRNRIYRTKFVLTQGSSTDREIVRTIPLIAASRQGAQSQELVGKTKNAIVFLNFDNELVELSNIADVNSLQGLPISDPIKPDFDSANFTNGHVFFSENNLYVSAPANSIFYVFDLQNKYWQPPQNIPIRLFSAYAGDLYGHSNFVEESYKLFTGLNDNDKPFTAIARFAYRNHNARSDLKNFDYYFTEMYMTPNAKVKLRLLFDYGGAEGIQTYEYLGTETDFKFSPEQAASLGVNSLGVAPLGGATTSPYDVIKYRRFQPTQSVDYFEYQAEYSGDMLDSQFQIISHGPNVQVSENFPVKLKQ